MNILFYLAAIVAVISTLMVILEFNPVQALLYLVVSLLSIAVIFFLLGAPFAAALEVIIYAGAIMVLFVFVIMMLNLGPQSAEEERPQHPGRLWFGPFLLSAALLAELVFVLRGGGGAVLHEVSPEEVGMALFGPYLLGTELASMLLLSGLIGAWHLGRGFRSAHWSKAGEKEEGLL
ncbi:MAG: NADH-quinone oxidoreductase subunit J [Syntrophobacteraceae bacterium]|nr:NADH-quinone oxidoreductase subunit J [Syntrophobacteraceae bacterium]